MNQTSSRSHAILQILIEQKWIKKEQNRVENEEGPQVPMKKRHFKKGLLTIVDLAGSERISKSGSEGVRLEEAKKINVSISSLGNCINALANNTNLQHVPFRSSKLTRLLTECLGGNSKTSICACVSPFLMNYDETLTTLQFASRAIKIKVDPHINEKIEMNVKEKLYDFSKIKNIESLIQENKNLEKDANELKTQLNNFKNDIKKVNSQKDVTQEIASPVKEDGGDYNTNNASEEYVHLTKKFHNIIIHLQSELAKSTVTIFNLREENKALKEKIEKSQL